MRFIRIPKSILSLICLAAVALYISGCLTADKSVSAVYDAKHDRFRFLIVYQNLATQPEKSAADLAWLRALYANRDHLILSPIGSPSPFEGLGEGSYLRISNTVFANLNLSETGAAGLTSDKAVIPLDDIQILPGRFFVRRQNSLCYFQQIIVPGKTVDELLKYANRRLTDVSSDSLVVGIDTELLRRQSGTVQMPWDAFSKAMIDQTTRMMKGEASEPGAPTTQIEDPLDTQTLQSIRAALAGGKLQITRSGEKIHISAEMTAADVSGLTRFFNAFRTAISNAANHPARESRRNMAWDAMLDSVSLTAADQTHVEATVDLIQLMDSFYNPLETPPSGSQPKGDKVVNMLNVAGDSLEIDTHLTVGKIVADFKADALASNPPVKSVEPGQGMGKIHATTEPGGETISIP